MPCNIFCDIALAAEEELGEAEEGREGAKREGLNISKAATREGGREKA